MKMICEVAGCGEELTEGCGSKGGPMLCGGCRTSSYYWKKQSLPAMRWRRERLNLFTSRLEYYEPRVTKILNAAKKSVASHNRKAKTVTVAATTTH